MPVVFEKKKDESVSYYDTLALPDGYGIRNFAVNVTVDDKGSAKNLQAGKISTFMLIDDDEGMTISLFSEGEWRIRLDDTDTIAEFAQSYFLCHFNTLNQMNVIRHSKERWLEDVREFEQDIWWEHRHDNL